MFGLGNKNKRAEDLKEEKYSEKGGIAGEGFYDEDEDYWGNLHDAHGNRIDNSTETGFEGLDTKTIDPMEEERLSLLTAKYQDGETSENEEAELRKANRI